MRCARVRQVLCHQAICLRRRATRGRAERIHRLPKASERGVKVSQRVRDCGHGRAVQIIIAFDEAAAHQRPLYPRALAIPLPCLVGERPRYARKWRALRGWPCDKTNGGLGRRQPSIHVVEGIRPRNHLAHAWPVGLGQQIIAPQYFRVFGLMVLFPLVVLMKPRDCQRILAELTLRDRHSGQRKLTERPAVEVVLRIHEAQHRGIAFAEAGRDGAKISGKERRRVAFLKVRVRLTRPFRPLDRLQHGDACNGVVIRIQPGLRRRGRGCDERRHLREGARSPSGRRFRLTQQLRRRRR